MSCSSCFADYLGKTTDSIRVYAQLSPLIQYTWIITDKFEKQYSGVVTTDGDGFFDIDIADLPAGLFTEYSGDFLLQVQDESCKPVKFKIAQEYDCISFHVKGGSREKSNIGCSFDCTAEAGDRMSSMVLFTDEDIVTIPWTTQLGGLYGNTPTIQVYHSNGSSYSLVNVSVQVNTNDEDNITSIVVDNGGEASGYAIIS